MAELKEFAGELRELPHISRHIGLAEELSRRCAQQPFRDRIAAEQSLLDGVALDSTCDTIEARRPGPPCPLPPRTSLLCMII